MPKVDTLAMWNAFKSILKYLITNVIYPLRLYYQILVKITDVTYASDGRLQMQPLLNIVGIILYCLKTSSTLLTVDDRVFITHGACYCSCASIEVIPFCS